MTDRLPSVYSTAFECPHCGAFTSHTWMNALSRKCSAGKPTPVLPEMKSVEELRAKLHKGIFGEDEEKSVENAIKWADQMYSGRPFIEQTQSRNIDYDVFNVFFARCFNCKELTIWRHDALLYPPVRSGPPPSNDLPDSIKVDYEEARSIVSRSPRGAAALLRLCVQKLCKELGEPGRNIDTDIASLVSKGLDPLVQEALDSVRVVGNEAVHPGQMDLKDDQQIAAELFAALNFIVDQTITRKKRLAELYDRLPSGKKLAIEERDKKARPS